MKTIKTFHLNLTCVLVFVLILAGSQVIAQDQITLKGRILDNKTNQPLPFATISISQSMTGVISNEFGEFQYHIPENFGNSVVSITYLGYKTIQLKVSEIQTGVLTTYKMETQVMQLPEVEVNGVKSKTEAVNIVRKAIRNIRKNYPTEKTLLYGYYRDYASPVGTHDYKNLIEAALVIEDKGFQTEDFSQTSFKLEQLRYNPEVEIDSSLNKAYDGKNKFIPYFSIAGANELSILRAHDPIRNRDILTFSFVDQFKADFARTHNFRFESITEVDSDKVYCIHFDKYVKYEENQSEYNVDGQIYISSKSFAILKFNYLGTCKTPIYSGKFLDVKLEYRKYNDRYYLNYLSLKNYFLINNNPHSGTNISSLNVIPYFQYRELFINKIVNKPFISIKPHEQIDKSASLLSNKIPVIEGFWDQYNFTGVSKLQE